MDGRGVSKCLFYLRFSLANFRKMEIRALVHESTSVQNEFRGIPHREPAFSTENRYRPTLLSLLAR
jgi:hypothetical protein